MTDTDWGDTFTHIMKARAAIEATGDYGGVVACPKCDGELQWVKARSNGHIHARCKTKGCLS